MNRRRIVSVAIGLVGLIVSFLAAFPALSAILGTGSLESVKSLSRGSRILAVASAVGKLYASIDGQLSFCTAALISPSYIITTAHCVSANGKHAQSIELVLGFTDDDSGSKLFKVRPLPVEIDVRLDYAILAVEGNPSVDFGPATLLMREPEIDEEIYVLQHASGKPLTVSRNCKVVSVGPQRAGYLINHTCDTLPGSSGALLFSARDNAVLGVHFSAFDASDRSSKYNRAIPLSEISSASRIVRALAWVRQGDVAAARVSERPSPITAPRADTSELQGDLTSPPQGGFAIAFADPLPDGMQSASELTVNGTVLRVAKAQARSKEVTVLGENVLRQGLNRIRSVTGDVWYWNEARVLRRFEQPYQSSYAIVAAIDDYDRRGDPAKRGPTGYQALSSMVDRAKEFEAVLIQLGVPKSNILTFYDQQATSANLEAALMRFWKGHALENTSRLIFYFGGHGASEDTDGLLVTYDHDMKKPTSTSFLMSSFITRHFLHVKAHHFLVLLDSCSSGLALGAKFLSKEPSETEQRRFATLANVRADTEARARNILTAGTGDQRALWETGGIFTKALIAGLTGRADFNADGVIQFAELALYVDQQVTAEASARGVRQDPHSYVADRYGNGKVLFIRPSFP